MQCQRCASDNPAGSAFCQECGTPLQIVCGACQRGCAPTARFCGWCGASVTRDSAVVEPRGERKQATVLFADIVGSTELIAGLDAEQAMDRLQPVVAAMARAVRRFDGTILRTLGDGLKAAFGAPIAREGHALLASQAALAIRDAVGVLDYAPRIRIGLHSGEVVAGALNTGSAVELEAQGMTVHLASRIEQLAAPGEILISGECRALIGAYCETTVLGSRALKGVLAPFELYLLTGMRPAVASDQFRGSELAPFRGRRAELDGLRNALLAAEKGASSVIGISAPAGLGKSRLCFEFSEWCRQRRIEVVEGRAHVFGQATPLLPVLEMFRTFLRVTPRLEPEQARERIVQRLGALGLDIAADLPVLFDFMGVADPDVPMPRIEPGGRQARLREIIRLLIKAAGQRTSVMIVEDMHWLDEASGPFMETVVEAVAGTRLVLVFNFRPPWPAAPKDCPYYQEIRLEELEGAEARQIVSDRIGDAPDLQPIVTHVTDRSGGNPFFAEQLILSLAQAGVLSGARGHYELSAAASPDVALPATVEAVIGARLDGLSEREKTVLQIGAIIGKEFPQALVEQVAGIESTEDRRLLDRLCDAELLQPRAVGSEPGFAFRHPLIQEVAYATQLRTRRTRLHAAVAGAMETQEWGRLDEFAGLLAHHCELAGDPIAAARHLQRAALWVGRTNSAQALADWKRICVLLRDQPRTDEVAKLRALASGQIVSYGWREGLSAEEARPYAEEALQYAREAGNNTLHEPLLLASYGRVLAAGGSADEYGRLVREALVVADADGDPARRGTLNVMLSQAYWQSGRLMDAIAANDMALTAFAARDEQPAPATSGITLNQLFGFDVEHWVKCLRTRILVWLGRFEEADLWIARVTQVDPAAIDHVVQFIPHFAAVELAWHRGDARSAEQHANIVGDYAEQSTLPYLRIRARACLGLAASTSGDFENAGHHFRAALTCGRNANAGLEFEARLLANLADTHHRAGNDTLAADTAAEAIAVAHRRTDRLAECHASVVAVAASGGRDPALLARARALLAETGAFVLEPIMTRRSIDASVVRGT